MSAILKIFSIIPKKQKKIMFFLGILMLIGAALEAIGIGMIIPVIALISNPAWLSEHPGYAALFARFGIANHTSFIISSAVCLIIVFVIKNLFLTLEYKLQLKYIVNNQILYASNLYKNYLLKPYLYHVDNNTMTLLRNVNTFPYMIFFHGVKASLSLITEVITAFVIWMVLVIFDSVTAISVGCVLGAIILGLTRKFRKYISINSEISKTYSAEMNKWLNQGLGAIKETKILHRENYFIDMFFKSYNKYGQANGKYNFIMQLPYLGIETLVIVTLGVLIIIKTVMDPDLTKVVSELSVLALAAIRLMPCTSRIVSYYNEIKFSVPLLDEIYNDLMEIRKLIDNLNNNDDEGENIRRKNAIPLIKEITIQNISFTYPKSTKEILKNVSFSIPKGSYVGLIGASGAGKTTFVDLFLGLLKPNNGTILIDNTDVFSNLNGWQENLAYVPQEIYLIDGTIKENIALGIDADDELINKVLEMAELKEYVSSLPEGVDTNVGERGIKLSGGQKQRIGLARALYTKPNILVLDEATSALDNETEKEIINTILSLKGKLTIVAVAHRISTLDKCDFKIEFENGIAQVVKNN